MSVFPPPFPRCERHSKMLPIYPRRLQVYIGISTENGKGSSRFTGSDFFPFLPTIFTFFPPFLLHFFFAAATPNNFLRRLRRLLCIVSRLIIVPIPAPPLIIPPPKKIPLFDAEGASHNSENGTACPFTFCRSRFFLRRTLSDLPATEL